ncbi:hypothetical protein [Micromonospora sp. Llam0]|uniref:hypothetical protein n=1 Tax=Micromonospora sp. Llam0 TaxID=2485143 RepID=UPI0011CE19FF|nr:hypothetical protein [Micromonospora sp. Llam0]
MSSSDKGLNAGGMSSRTAGQGVAAATGLIWPAGSEPAQRTSTSGSWWETCWRLGGLPGLRKLLRLRRWAARQFGY